MALYKHDNTHEQRCLDNNYEVPYPLSLSLPSSPSQTHIKSLANRRSITESTRGFFFQRDIYTIYQKATLLEYSPPPSQRARTQPNFFGIFGGGSTLTHTSIHPSPPQIINGVRPIPRSQRPSNLPPRPPLKLLPRLWQAAKRAPSAPSTPNAAEPAPPLASPGGPSEGRRRRAQQQRLDGGAAAEPSGAVDALQCGGGKGTAKSAVRGRGGAEAGGGGAAAGPGRGGEGGESGGVGAVWWWGPRGIGGRWRWGRTGRRRRRRRRVGLGGWGKGGDDTGVCES